MEFAIFFQVIPDRKSGTANMVCCKVTFVFIETKMLPIHLSAPKMSVPDIDLDSHVAVRNSDHYFFFHNLKLFFFLFPPLQGTNPRPWVAMLAWKASSRICWDCSLSPANTVIFIMQRRGTLYWYHGHGLERALGFILGS